MEQLENNMEKNVNSEIAFSETIITLVPLVITIVLVVIVIIMVYKLYKKLSKYLDSKNNN